MKKSALEAVGTHFSVLQDVSHLCGVASFEAESQETGEKVFVQEKSIPETVVTRLPKVPGVPKVLRNSQGVVIFSSPGRPLLASESVKVAPQLFLSRAVQLATTLASLASFKIVHGAVSNENLFVDDHDHVFLVNFSQAVVSLGGAASQDLFDLGNVFYSWLTGSQGLGPDDQHVSSILPDLSPRIANIVDALLHQRYETVWGLAKDLQELVVAPLTDNPLRLSRPYQDFRIPAKLYGSDALKEKNRILATPSLRLALIYGEGGIGKSRLARSCIEGATSSKDAGEIVLLRAKFSQSGLSLFLPFTEMLSTLHALVPTNLLGALVETLEAALGNRVSLITQISPAWAASFSHYLSNPLQPERGLSTSITLSSREGELLFAMALRTVIRTVCRALGASRVLFCVDDIQWASSVALTTFEALAKAQDPQCVLILTSRVPAPDSPAATFCKEIQAKVEAHEAGVAFCELSGFGAADIEAILSDALGLVPAQVSSLAQELFGLSSGNPFHAFQLLLEMYRSDVLFFDQMEGKWAWKLEALSSMSCDSSADLLTQRMQRLEEDHVSLLQTISCFSSTVSLRQLSCAVPTIPTSQLQSTLTTCVSNGFLLETISSENDPVFGFAHDRLMHAAYLSMTPVERTRRHATLACEMLNARDESLLLELTHQIVEGVGHLTQHQDAVKFGEVATKTGAQALKSMANEDAFRILKVASTLLQAAPDDTPDEDLISLSIQLADAARKTQRCEDALSALDHLDRLLSADKTRDVVDRQRIVVTANIQRLLVLEMLEKFQDCIALGKTILKQVGFALPDDLDMGRAHSECMEVLEQCPCAQAVAALVDAKEATDWAVVTASEVLYGLVSASYIAGDLALYCFVNAFSTKIALQHGLSPSTGTAVGCYGFVLSAFFDKHVEGTWFGQVCQALTARFPGYRIFECRTLVCKGLVAPWSESLDRTASIHATALAVARDAGDFAYMGYSTVFFLWAAFSACQRLSSLTEFLRTQDHVALFKLMPQNHDIVVSLSQVLTSLTEGSITPKLEQVNAPPFISGSIYFHLMVERLVHDDLEAAAQLFRWFREFSYQGITGMVPFYEFHFWAVLVLGKLCYEPGHDIDTLAGMSRSEVYALMTQYTEKLAQWDAVIPETWHAKYRLALVVVKLAADVSTCGAEAKLELLKELGIVARLAHERQDSLVAAFAWRIGSQVCHSESVLQDRIGECLANHDAEMAAWGCHVRLAPVQTASEAWAKVASCIPDVTFPSRDLEHLAVEMLRGVLRLSQCTRAVIVFADEKTFWMNQREDLLLERPDDDAESPFSADIFARLRTSREDFYREAPRRAAEKVLDPVSHVSSPTHVVPAAFSFALVVGTRLLGRVYVERPRDFLVAERNPLKAYATLLASHWWSSHDQDVPVTEMPSSSSSHSGDLLSRLVSERTQTLKIQMAKLEAIQDVSPHGISVVLSDGTILEANSALLRYFGSTVQVIGSKFQDLVVRLDDSGLQGKPVSESLNLEELIGRESGLDVETCTAATGDSRGAEQGDRGRPFVLHASKVVMEDDFVLYIVFFTDMLAAREADRAKNLFLANMSHEIRTPMNGVFGMLSLLNRTPLSDTQTHYLSTCMRSAEALLNVLNDVLLFSRGEAGAIQLEHAPFCVHDLVEDVIHIAASKVSENQSLDVTYLIGREVPAMLVGDTARLRQVLLNLVSNSVKFTNEGEVSLEISLVEPSAPASDDRVSVRFDVIDSGIGIAPEELKSLFRPFMQADASTTRMYGGTGLGLAICHQLVKLFGGEISVTSRLGRGSTFSVVLPFERYPEAQSDKFALKFESLDLLRGLKTLVIDDNATNCLLIKFMLEDAGCIVKTERSPEAGIDQIKVSAHKGQNFDLLILDYNMPRMSGLDVARTLQGLNIGVPIIGLSSSMVHERLLREPNIMFVSSKPIRRSHLMELVYCTAKRIRTGSPSGSPASALQSPRADQPAMGSLAGLRVLVAEDNETNMAFLKTWLEELDVEVVAATNGLAAIDVSKKFAPGDLHYALFDVHMPLMDGLQALRLIKSTDHPDLKCVMITADVTDSTKRACLAGGAQDVVLKPAPLQKIYEFLAEVRNAVPQKAKDKLQIPSSDDEKHVKSRVPPSLLRVGIVDDSDTNRETMEALCSSIMGAESVVLQVFVNGVDLLQKISPPSRTMFDVIFLDVHLPFLDGPSVARSIRALSLEKRPTIVGTTGDETPKTLQTCMAAGMDAVLIKPVTIADLEPILLRSRVAAVTPTTYEADGGDSMLFDKSTLSALSVRAQTRLLGVWMDQSRCDIDTLRQMAQTGQFSGESAREQAHRIKGAAAQVGAVAIRAVAGHLEAAAKAGSLSGHEFETLSQRLADLREKTILAIERHTSSLESK